MTKYTFPTGGMEVLAEFHLERPQIRKRLLSTNGSQRTTDETFIKENDDIVC